MVFNLLGLIKSSGIIPVKELKGLLNKGEYVEAYADDIYGPVYTVNHTLNGLIPIGTEYYYEILDAQTGYVYFVRASKSFAKKADKGYAVAVRGKVRTMDSESFKYFDSENSSIIESGYKSGYEGKILYIDNFVFFNSILGVIASLLILI